LQYIYNNNTIDISLTISIIRNRCVQTSRYNHRTSIEEALQTSWQTGWSVSSNNCKSESEEGRLTNTKTAIRCQYTQGHDINSDCPSFLLLQATSYRANTNIAVVSCRQMHGNNSSAVGITHQEGQQPISHIIS